MNAEQVRQHVLAWIRYLPMPDYTTTRGERGAVIGLLDDVLKLDSTPQEAKQRRYKVLAWLFRDYLRQDTIPLLSSKSLPDECWWALVQFTDVRKDEETGEYVSGRDGFADEIVMCWQAMETWESDLLANFGMEDENEQ